METLCALAESKVFKSFLSGVSQWLIHLQHSQEEYLGNLGAEEEANSKTYKAELH